MAAASILSARNSAVGKSSCRGSPYASHRMPVQLRRSVQKVELNRPLTTNLCCPSEETLKRGEYGLETCQNIVRLGSVLHLCGLLQGTAESGKRSKPLQRVTKQHDWNREDVSAGHSSPGRWGRRQTDLSIAETLKGLFVSAPARCM